MKRIICKMRPFEKYQSIYAYEDDNQLIAEKTTYEDFYDTLFEIVAEYDIDDIRLFGPKQYNRGLKKQIEQKILDKYTEKTFSVQVM